MVIYLWHRFISEWLKVIFLRRLKLIFFKLTWLLKFDTPPNLTELVLFRTKNGMSDSENGACRTPEVAFFQNDKNTAFLLLYYSTCKKNYINGLLYKVIEDILLFVVHIKRPLRNIWLLRYKSNNEAPFWKIGKNTQLQVCIRYPF